MKKLILILLISFCYSNLKAQAPVIPIDSNTKEVAYVEIVKVDKATKDELYSRAREWFATTYNSSKSVIEMEDRTAGKIIGKGASEGSAEFVGTYTPFWLKYTITVSVKEGRYRYEISNFSYQNKPTKLYNNPKVVLVNNLYQDKHQLNSDGNIKEAYWGYYKKVQSMGEFLGNSLKQALSSKVTGVKSKDDF